MWWWSRPEQYADIASGEHVGKFGYARDNETDLVRPFSFTRPSSLLYDFRAGELSVKVNLITPCCTCEGNVSRDWYEKTCFPDCSGAAESSLARVRLRQCGRRWRQDSEQGGYGPAWQGPCTRICDVGISLRPDLGWRLQDKI